MESFFPLIDNRLINTQDEVVNVGSHVSNILIIPLYKCSIEHLAKMITYISP